MLLDTNVISEILKPDFSVSVANWVRCYPRVHLFTTAITESEILYGIAIMPRGKKRSLLAVEVEGIFRELFTGRILAFDSKAARAYAEISSSRRLRGRPMSQADAQIAAIAVTHSATLATRDTTDFDGCGIKLVNPWVAIGST